jgi:gliding motility-associated-like protein
MLNLCCRASNRPIYFPMKSIGFALVIAMLTPIFMFAEGSKDFRDYPGKRLWLDTRDDQQMKVYAAEGEFINVGASHVGISDGFITVYRPDGTVAQTFDNSGSSTGLGIINNDIEELNGPIGGATGFNPGVLQVGADEEGAWTVVFDFPNYQISSFDTLSNNEPWTRASNQVLGNRVVLAWDITVTQGGAGNNGGTTVEGRVYSNEYISILNKNGNLTSPTFYLLSQDGSQYAVNFLDADPFRFPISSNSLGLVESDQTPIYKSKQRDDFTRSDDPASWTSGELYLYEPQAEDAGSLINHKIFFNLPDTLMPSFTLTTDIFRENQHQTWLFSELQNLVLDSIFFFGVSLVSLPCQTPYFELNEGGFFVTNTTIAGHVTIRLDIDENGSFEDPIDIAVSGFNDGGLDSIFWDGLDGLGNPFGVLGDTFQLNYDGKIRFGEIHIANTDVEDNFGGVTFELLNGGPDIPANSFYYDHSDLTAVNGAVSGGGTTGNALPTSSPFTYGNGSAIIPSGNFGNDKYLDQWVFIDVEIPPGVFDFLVVEDCVCPEAFTPILSVLSSSSTSACVNDSAVLQVTNTNGELGDLTYIWQGPNGFFFTETIGSGDTSMVNITSVNQASAGDYMVTSETMTGCGDSITVSLSINLLPVLTIDQSAFSGCEGETLLISGTSTIGGIGGITYELTGPNFNFTTTDLPVGVFAIPIVELNSTNEGTFTLTITDDNGCSNSSMFEVSTEENPVITNISGAGSYCAGQDITFSGENSATGISEITYTWSGPNGFFDQQTTTNTTGPFVATLTGVLLIDIGDYTLCLTSNENCGPICETVAVTVTPSLEIIDITGDGNQCIGQTFTLSAGNNITNGVNEVTYTWTLPDGSTFVGTAPAAGPFDLEITDPTAADGGSYTLMLVGDNGCTSNPDAVVEVVMDPTPVLAEITGGGAFCEGNEVTLVTNNMIAGVGNFTTTWTLPNGTILGGGAGTDPFFYLIPTLSPADTGTYTVSILTDEGCVSNTVSTQVTLSMLPMVINVSSDTIICDNDEFILSATNAGMDEISYVWTGSNGYTASGTAAGGAIFTETIDPIGTFGGGAYTLVVSAGGCDADPVTVNIETRPNPDLAPIFGGGSYCVGDSVTLYTFNTTPGIDSIFYTCILPNADIVVELSGGTDTIFIIFPSITMADAGILSCAAESTDSCGSSLVTAVIEVQVTPLIENITPDATICSGENLILTASNGAMGTGDVTYTWTGPNGFTFIGTAPFGGPFPIDISNVTVDNTGEYCLNVTTDAGCAADEICTNVTVNLTPMLTPTDGGGDYCEGDDATLITVNTVVGVGDLTFTCTGPNGFEVTGTVGESETIELILENITMDDAGTYTCVVTSAEGCVSNESSATIAVNATPAISDINGGGPYCEGETINLTASNDVQDVGMIEYTWTGPNGFTFTGMADGNGLFTASVPNVELNDAGEYCLTITSMAGCGGDEMCVMVEVNPNPIVTEFTGGGEYCEGDVTTLAGTIDLNGATMVDWTMTGPGLDESGTSTNNETISFDVTTSEDTAGSYTFTLTSEDGCAASATQTITLIEVPIPMLAASADIICPGDELQLTITNDMPAGVTYEWFENGVSLGTSNDLTFMVMSAEGGTYSVTVTLMGCSESSTDITVSAVAAPVAVDDSYEIEFDTELNDNVTNNDQTSLPAGVTATLDTESTNGTVTFNEDGSFTYTPNEGFVGTDGFIYTICSVDCPEECSSAIATIVISVPSCDNIFNAITPNGDGDNDVFFVPCLEGSGPNNPGGGQFPTNTLKIFNRWGDVVYEQAPYGNDWGGFNSDLQDLPNGTYFYMIELRDGGGDGEENLKVGYVTVSR